ncbi:hypothetical protein A2960_05685 [Candidatus Gottesmanbacteria bacterium RIFCSPLOWO2_01_FULL_39_12b]|uniref:Uncharacterized protein n=1 Tax=Candidatus Gottesmanbacteria bacterium RIFCSPLOWO2_01_FULL_39_12b TaxID=1798388 RepID=A0A1F6AP14_9BACT|nr:MAG: hypothetical protein A2960_05685 [Candidatus Gottesmanbacteria bacterium RIFCSPLOWO2_01_FULL_39_12b]
MATTPEITCKLLAVTPDGYPTGEKRPLTEDEIPQYLKNPAQGKFPLIEQSLPGGSFPEGWQVRHALAAIIHAIVKLDLKDSVPQDTHVQTSLMIFGLSPEIPPLFSIRFETEEIGEVAFKGDIYIPGNSRGPNFSGIPWANKIPTGQTVASVTYLPERFINHDQTLTSLGRELVGGIIPLLTQTTS